MKWFVNTCPRYGGISFLRLWQVKWFVKRAQLPVINCNLGRTSYRQRKKFPLESTRVRSISQSRHFNHPLARKDAPVENFPFWLLHLATESQIYLTAENLFTPAGEYSCLILKQFNLKCRIKIDHPKVSIVVYNQGLKLRIATYRSNKIFPWTWHFTFANYPVNICVRNYARKINRGN